MKKKRRKIPIREGVRQGNTISHKCFTACMEEVFKKLEWDDMGPKTDEYPSNLRFAKNIVLLSNSGENLEKMINDLHKESLKVGFEMNMKMTKVM